MGPATTLGKYALSYLAWSVGRQGLIDPACTVGRHSLSDLAPGTSQGVEGPVAVPRRVLESLGRLLTAT